MAELPEDQEGNSKHSSSLASRAKKNIGGKLASSKLGRKALKESLPQEVTNLIQAVKACVEKHSKSSKTANEIETNLLKIAIKTYVIVHLDKNLQVKDFLKCDKPFRTGLEIFTKCYNYAKYKDRVNHEKLLNALKEVEKNIEGAGTILTQLLTPFMKPQTLQRIKETTDYIAKPGFLKDILLDPSLSAEVEQLYITSDKYTQFHFHED